MPVFNTPGKPATGKQQIFMSDFTETQASALIGTAEKMIEIWSRLSPEKQSALLARFGTQENALAALVTTHLVSPRDK
ncbi:hypothetical protein ALQ99_01216 [Pseudomonas syringae pv. lapsa]|nr:Uncharacterized protein ALO39_03160 [Pseudomonas syringae pv. lapsa]RML19302.1 hypothetical protein ALQ99_01216 [Pseudomonas syringae pv. lapsa]RML25992.1 hypothetical protein ALQ98_02843 [Pseudomonas syringae pv. lapsa]RMU64467.1 hypothetical protein ALP25_01204 [Pseudomonas syringae pv. syringae]